MKILILILFFLVQTAYAQVFVTENSQTKFKFQGTLITEGNSDKGIVTIRERSGSQHILVVNEVVDFHFPTNLEELEFNDEFMESQYFPQIRITGKLKEKVDLTKDGIYIVHFTGRFTLRQQTVEMEFPVRMELAGKKMTFSFEQNLDLTKFYVPYAGTGSDIGKFADYIFSAELKRTH